MRSVRVFALDILIVFTLFLALHLSQAKLCAENWPGWRGPAGQGISQETNLPVTWSTTENVRKYEVLAMNKLGERTNASIAVSQGDIFIRTHKHLWCIGGIKNSENH